VAHLGYFRDEFVVRRRWLSERSYADLVALCQFLPGPASSQVGLALGLSRAGYRGAFAAWAGFTLPSALILMLFATSLAFQGSLNAGVLQGLKVVAVAVVAQAVWGMARTLCPDRLRVTLMAASAVLVLQLPFIWTQPPVLLGAGRLGMLMIKPTTEEQQDDLRLRVSGRAGIVALGLFLVLLVGLPLLGSLFSSELLSLVDSFSRVGARVFGGGHVLLPLLPAEPVQRALLDIATFLAGHGATQ